jgi:RimJ/RimL family protein N-acetyltransferase
VTLWMAVATRPPLPALPGGFSLRARSDVAHEVHHLSRRSGDKVAERLSECSLHQPDLDLAAFDDQGQLAAYGPFWADPSTGVGLVEPMRTEHRYQRMGLGRVVLPSGLDRLAGRGCSRLKVSYIVGNEASRRLYVGAGFEPSATSRTYRRPRGSPWPV